MHKSRLGGLIIDCCTENLDMAAKFWSEALGLPKRQTDDPMDSNYVGLVDEPNELHIEVQKVDHESRVHLDIESDDLEAEVARLEKLGAKRLKTVRDWIVMVAPTGQRFCIVKPQRSRFAEDANVWE